AASPGLREGLGSPWVETHLHEQPLLCRGWEEKEARGSPAPLWGSGTGSTVAWTPLLLLLLSHCTGSLSQPVLTQPPSFSTSGASASLTCTLRSDINVSRYRIYWYQQKPESPPRYLLSYYSDSYKHQGSGVPSRFSGSKDASVNAGLLLISGLQPEDEADYYCKTGYGNASHSDTHRWGGGTKTSACPGSSSMIIFKL
uniref:Immunoglobulin lambda variable 5-37 n=1 Tax=Macaca fascicularis TaxID=9541 RepID=A0A7N9CT80_MACFA